jgi:hypothetical protein
MKDDLVSIWNERVVTQARYYPGIYLEELKGKKTSIRVAGVPAEIRTEQLWNTSLERYC